MTDQPHSHHSEDAEADDGPPTDAVTDEVREDAVQADQAREAASDRPAQTHP